MTPLEEARLYVEKCIVERCGNETISKQIEEAIFSGSEKWGVDYVDFAYESMGKLIKYGGENLYGVLCSIQCGDEGWNGDIFSDIKNRKLDEIRIQNLKPACIEWNHPCSVCKQFKFFLLQGIQDRSMDEGSSSYIICATCPNPKKIRVG
jgi:hypothetical protein